MHRCDFDSMVDTHNTASWNVSNKPNTTVCPSTPYSRRVRYRRPLRILTSTSPEKILLPAASLPPAGIRGKAGCWVRARSRERRTRGAARRGWGSGVATGGACLRRGGGESIRRGGGSGGERSEGGKEGHGGPGVIRFDYNADRIVRFLWNPNGASVPTPEGTEKVCGSRSLSEAAKRSVSRSPLVFWGCKRTFKTCGYMLCMTKFR